MTQKELLYIMTIAETESISKAAEKLFIAQPSLSHSLQRVEADLGAELFKRTFDGLKPTVAGEYYIAVAKNILKEYKDLETKISWLNSMKAGKLVLGTTNFLGSIIIPDLLYIFNELYPNVEVEIVESVSAQIEEQILKGKIDVGVFHMPLGTDALQYKTLVKERFLLAVPPKDPINQKCYVKDHSGEWYIDLRLTDRKNYVLTHPEQRTRQRCDAILSNAKITPEIKYLTQSIQTAVKICGMGLGYTLVPHSYCNLFNSEHMPKFYFMEEEFEPYWKLAICYSKEIPLSKPAAEMIRICSDLLPNLYGAEKLMATGRN